MHPTGPMLAFQLNIIPEIFSEALASPAYMVATPMQTRHLLKGIISSYTTISVLCNSLSFELVIQH